MNEPPQNDKKTSDDFHETKAELQALKHEVELLRLKNEMLQKNLDEKEAWHEERGEQIQRLIKEKQGLEAHMQMWIEKWNEAKQSGEPIKKEISDDQWARRKSDVQQKTIKVIETEQKESRTKQKTEDLKVKEEASKAKHVESEEKNEISLKKTQPSDQDHREVQQKQTIKKENLQKDSPAHLESSVSSPKVSVNVQGKPRKLSKAKLSEPIKSKSQEYQTPHRKLTFAFAVLFLMLCTVIPSKLSNWVLTLEIFKYQELKPTPKTSDKVKLLLITDEDLEAFGAWPWTRDVFSIFHHYLTDYCEVKTIVYDIMFVEKSFDEYDDAFAKALDIEHANNTILAAAVEKNYIEPVSEQTNPFSLSSIEQGQEGFILPYEKFFHPAKVGTVNTNTRDRQRLVPIFFNINNTYIPNLSFLAAMNYADVQDRMFFYKHGEYLNIKAWEKGEDRLIPLYNKNEFLVTPYDDVDDFDHFSFSELYQYISEDKPINVLKDSIVFIGINDQVSDVHKNARGKAVPGVLFHAGIASNIINGDFIHPIETFHLWLSLCSAAIFAILWGMLCNRWYLLKKMFLQRALFISLPLIAIGSFVIVHYHEGGGWRPLLFTGLHLAFLLPIAIIKWERKTVTLKEFETVDLSERKTLQYTILTQAPRPMALAYERYLQVTSDKTQHASTVFEERVVRFMGLVHLAVLFRSGGKVDQKFIQAIENDTQDLQRPLAAGTCIGFGVYVRKVLKAAEDQRFFKFKDPKAFRETFLKERQAGGHYDLGNKALGPIAFETWLVKYWNQLKLRMFVYLGHEKQDDEKVLSYEYLGGTQRLGKQTIASDLELDLHHIYLINLDGTLIDLFPFFIYRSYEQTQPKEILEFYQVSPKGGVIYKSLNGTETVEMDDLGIGEILQSWKKQTSATKKNLLTFRELQGVFNDDLKPWSVGDIVLNDWVIEKELMRQHGGYWYLAKLKTPGGQGNSKCLLNFYLKGTVGYEGVDALKTRLSDDINHPFIMKPMMSSESSRGFWVQYPDAHFLDYSEVNASVLREMKEVLRMFHQAIGPQHLLSEYSFVRDKDQSTLLIFPGIEPNTYGQQGVGLARMLDKYKQKELKLLESLF